MNANDLGHTISQWLIPGLTALLCLAGAGVAAIFAQRYPGPALLTLIGMVMLAFVAVGGQLATTFILARRVADGLTAQQISMKMAAAGAVFGLLRAVAYVLLVTAVFQGRQPAPPPFPGAVPRPPY